MTEPTPPFNVRAIAAYEARNNTEVSLEIGKIYNVGNTDGKGLWWQTKCSYDGHIGWFPASYTEVVYDSAPPVPTPDPYPPQAYDQSYSQVSTGQQNYQTTNSTTSASTSHTQASSTSAQTTSSDSPAAGERPPEPVNKPQRQKETTPVYVTLQLCKARGLRGDASKTNPVGFIYKRNIMDPQGSLGEELFKTDTKSKLAPKKTTSPEWNERFTINVKDAETEIVCVRFANAPKFTAKGTKYLGEIEFPLRGAVRDFDKPNYKYKWYPIKGKGKDGPSCTGDALIYIEFVDTRESAPPTNFEHKSHVGLTKDGAFDINNIPAEWKKIFKSVGLRKQDLQNNMELAKAVIEVMEQDTNSNNSAVQTQASAPPLPPVISPTPPPPPPIVTQKAPVPPPVPRPVEQQQQEQYSEPAGYAPEPTPEPEQVSAPAVSGGGGGGGGSFLDAIAARTTKLRPVEPPAAKPPASSSSLADTLKAAMIAHRKDIEGDDEDEDDWSE